MSQQTGPETKQCRWQVREDGSPTCRFHRLNPSSPRNFRLRKKDTREMAIELTSELSATGETRYYCGYPHRCCQEKAPWSAGRKIMSLFEMHRRSSD